MKTLDLGNVSASYKEILATLTFNSASFEGADGESWYIDLSSSMPTMDFRAESRNDGWLDHFRTWTIGPTLRLGNVVTSGGRLTLDCMQSMSSGGNVPLLPVLARLRNPDTDKMTSLHGLLQFGEYGSVTITFDVVVSPGAETESELEVLRIGGGYFSS